MNRDVRHAWAYHNATKHSYESVRTGAHFLDWQNHPLPFKMYRTLEPIPLPKQMRQSGVPALAAIATAQVEPAGQAVPDLEALTQVLYFAAGITRRRTYPGGEILFRAAACTGALYEFELYLACAELAGLEAGLYHFSPAEIALRRLRAGDWRGALARAAADEPSVAHASVIIICAGTYWRNAWKYRARTYRHFGWDNGTLLANLLAEAAALRLPAKVVLGFVDAEVNHLLGLDTHREVAFSMVALGRVAAPPPPAPAETSRIEFETAPLSRKEVDYPEMREIHRESALDTLKEVAVWRGAASGPVRQAAAGASGGRMVRLEALGDDQIPRDSIEEVILRRGSSRAFVREPIGFAQFSTMLDRSARGIPADFLAPPGAQLNGMYVIAHAVEGLNSGAYFFRREERALECLKEGDFRDAAGYLGMEQELPADCSAVVFFLADLEPVLERFGNRGYRAVQLEAGILGGKLYLSAYAQRLGASGLTFFDDDVTAFFSPHAAGKSAIFLVALGRGASPEKPG